MASYDITKLDLYSIPNLKRGELCNIHSILLYLYSKHSDINQVITLRYSEIKWMNRNLVAKTITSLERLKLVEILERPNRSNNHKSLEIKLLSDDQIQYNMNTNKKLNFEKYLSKNLMKNDIKEILECHQIKEYYNEIQINNWIKHVNKKVWEKETFLIYLKIISYLQVDYRIKTFTLQKYIPLTDKQRPFTEIVKLLYSKIPLEKKDIIYLQLSNTLSDLKIKHNKRFQDMADLYRKYLLKN